MPKTLNELARQIVKGEQKATEAQREALRSLVDKDRKLRNSIIDEAIETAIAAAIYTARHTALASTKRTAEFVARSDSRIPAAAESAMRESILDTWTLPDGRTVLGDADGPLLLECASKCFAQADGLTQNAQFYQALGRQLRAGQTCRSAMTDRAVAELWANIAALGKTPKAAG